VPENKSICPLLSLAQRPAIAALLLLASVRLLAGQTSDEWQLRVRNDVENKRIEAALTIVEQRLAYAPEDLEAHGWRGRLLAWKGRWSEGEAEFKLVLDKFPNDTEILTALADVLLWQQKYLEALRTLDRARKVSPPDPEILSRRARILVLLGRTPEARSEYQQALRLDSQNRDAKAALAGLIEDPKRELRVGEDIDFLNYTNAAQTQGASLSSRWNHRWSTVIGVNTYQRFGQDAVKFVASGSFHATKQNWIGAGGAVANSQGVVPTSEAFFEYGHGFRIKNRWIHGLESSYRQHWFWYQGAHVLALNTSQVVYLPREWTLSLNFTGARTGFASTPA
jgi:Flp pilus assembly protein TadD